MLAVENGFGKHGQALKPAQKKSAMFVSDPLIQMESNRLTAIVLLAFPD